METIKSLLMIGVYVALVNNFVLAQFLGLCPFIGVTKKTSSAFGMGLAVTFVMTMASIVTYSLYTWLLVPCKLGFLTTASFILVIAALVQLVEMALRKVSPPLYGALGIYLPLITTNCAVLGVALLNTTKAPERGFTLLQAAVSGLFAGVGFTIAMLLMSGVRENLEYANVPKALRGAPIAFIATGLMALAFMGFSGMVALD